MHYYLALTSKCNLLCKYCYGKTTEDFMTQEESKEYDLTLPKEINFTIDDLKKYAQDDPNFELTFYGGEPLMKIDKIIEIMNNVPVKTFMIQTNGILLHKLPPKYLNKLHTILVSIDGGKKHTNERRGNLVYEKVIRNIKLARKNGFKGEIIGRMTVDETSNVYENVRHLISLNLFDSIHWQLDAQFWKSDYKERNFREWTKNNYNPNISKLIVWWVNEIRQKRTHKIYPFVGVLNRILSKNPEPMPCGSGHSLLGIQTNGKVVACPITAGYKPFKMGDVRNSSLREIKKNKILPKGKCTHCEIYSVCGGRCLYANYTMLWGEKGFDEVCDTTKHLVKEIKKIIPIVDEEINRNLIKKEVLEYRKYNGCEIIP